MQTDARDALSGGSSSDGGSPSEAVAIGGSWGKQLRLPQPFGLADTDARVFTDGRGLVALNLGAFGFQTEVWTTEGAARVLAAEILESVNRARDARGGVSA